MLSAMLKLPTHCLPFERGTCVTWCVISRSFGPWPTPWFPSHHLHCCGWTLPCSPWRSESVESIFFECESIPKCHKLQSRTYHKWWVKTCKNHPQMVALLRFIRFFHICSIYFPYVFSMFWNMRVSLVQQKHHSSHSSFRRASGWWQKNPKRCFFRKNIWKI